MKILALGTNSTKFCIHNLWSSRELEIQKLTTQNGEECQKIKILSLGCGTLEVCGERLARGPLKAGLAAS